MKRNIRSRNQRKKFCHISFGARSRTARTGPPLYSQHRWPRPFPYLVKRSVTAYSRGLKYTFYQSRLYRLVEPFILLMLIENYFWPHDLQYSLRWSLSGKLYVGKFTNMKGGLYSLSTNTYVCLLSIYRYTLKLIQQITKISYKITSEFKSLISQSNERREPDNHATIVFNF